MALFNSFISIVDVSSWRYGSVFILSGLCSSWQSMSSRWNAITREAVYKTVPTLWNDSLATAIISSHCELQKITEKSLYLTARYSRTSLSRTRLFWITAYLEVKIWSLFKHETMTTGDKIMWKRLEQFLLFSTLFYIYISNFRSQITYSFVKCGCSIYCFPHSLNSDMLRYGYLEVFQWVPWNSR